VIYVGAFHINNILSLFAGLVLLITFTIGFGMLTSALDVRFRDINFFVQAILIIWFYATPIVYSINVVPYRLMWIWRLNPMTSITQLLQNFFVSAPGPGIGMLISNVSIIFVITVIGIIIFRNESRNFDDWV
jgi:ABC-type polysaccharide/polyol phosphate export permease